VPALDQIRLYLFQWNPNLFAAGFGDQAIPEILKPRPMLFQVNENCDLAAFTIGYKLNSSHGFILPHAPAWCPAIDCKNEGPNLLASPISRKRVPVKLHKDVTTHLKVVIEKEAVAE
jgi:hypothetical protein